METEWLTCCEQGGSRKGEHISPLTEELHEKDPVHPVCEDRMQALGQSWVKGSSVLCPL